MNAEEYPDSVLICCKEVFGIDYPYPWQRLVIKSVLDATLPTENQSEPLRKIAILPTGAGKSLCWMLPAVLIPGITVAVFPLLSLMSDQKRRLDACSIPSLILKGGQSRIERSRIWTDLEKGKAKIVLANPEVLQSLESERRLGNLKPVFLAVDETHTVSQWGETFRPACAGLGRLVKAWNPGAVLALTATAGPEIRQRITELLFNGEAPHEALADPDRPAIRYGVVPALSRNHALERLVREKQRPMIVFGSTRPGVEQAARLLRNRFRDDRIRFYHAGLEPEEKGRLEEWFLGSSDGILCATCAYGLGVDKSNIRTVIHLAPPSSVEAYLQESGRASRDGKGAEAWLIWTPKDLADRDTTIAQEVNPIEERITNESDSGTPLPSDTDSSNAETVNRVRRQAMTRYASSTERCRREMLLEALGIEAQDCTGCDVCGDEAWVEPPEAKIIFRVARWNRGRYRKGQLARILIGRRNVEIRQTGLDLVRGFGALWGWELEDAEEAMAVLIHSGRLQVGRFKGRIFTIRSKRQVIQILE